MTIEIRELIIEAKVSTSTNEEWKNNASSSPVDEHNVADIVRQVLDVLREEKEGLI